MSLSAETNPNGWLSDREEITSKVKYCIFSAKSTGRNCEPSERYLRSMRLTRFRMTVSMLCSKSGFSLPKYYRSISL